MITNIEQFDNQNYLNLQTYRKSGQVMLTPVWFVRDGDVFYIRTGSDSGKVKRIRNNEQVRIMPCGQAGEPLGEWVSGRGREITDAPTGEKVGNLLYAKYGEMAKTFEAQALASGQRYTVIEVIL